MTDSPTENSPEIMADQPSGTTEQAHQPDGTTELAHQPGGTTEQSPPEQPRSAADRPEMRERARPTRRRRLPRHRRSLRRRLLSENLRLLASSVLSLGVGAVIVVPLASSIHGAETAEVQLPLFLILLIITVSLYSLTFAGLTCGCSPLSRAIAWSRPRACPGHGATCASTGGTWAVRALSAR